MTKLADCITAHGVKTHTRLPADVKAAVAAGDTALAVSTMQAHVAALKALKQTIEIRHEENKKDFMAQTVSKTSAASYVNRGAADPTNELNHFQVKSFSKIWKNLVQRAGSFGAAVGLLRAKPDQVTPGEQAVLEHFMTGPESFGRQMSATINAIFKAKGMHDGPKAASSFPFRYEDMIQYLPVRYPAEFGEKSNPKVDEQHARDNGILDGPTRSAIAATAYEWIATSGRKSMAQTESSLGRLLGLQKDEPLPGNSWELLEHAGMNAETVARQLGKTILQRLSIAPGPKSDSLAQSRMEESLGFMALAAMESMGVIERQYVIADHTEKARAALIAAGKPVPAIGLNALKEDQQLEPGELFYTDNGSPEGPQGLLMMRLVKVADLDLLTDIEEHFKEGRAAFDKVFANEPQDFGMQWKAQVRKAFKIGSSNVEANAEQTRNINKYSSIPYQRNPEAIGFLKSMWGLVEGMEKGEGQDRLKAVFYEALGAPPAENLLKLHKKGNEGIRRGIEQDFRDVLNYEDEHAKRAANGESTEFYLSSDFMSNMRMIMRGDINPQNSKMHRSLFAPTGFQTTFKKDPKGKLDQAFLEAVAVAFDIETGKGLIGDAAAQVAGLMDIITNPGNDKHEAVTAAIKAIQAYQTTGEMTSQAMEVIAVGSAKVDNKVTGLKGLFEYARYAATPVGAEFSTDMHAEIDGVSNGVIIGILQLIPDSANKRAVLATLAMGGISTSTVRADLNKLLIQNNLNDAYQRMAQEWAKEILTLKKKWDTSEKSKDNALFEKAEALGRILGEFQDPQGVINKTIRNLSKPRTMQIIYGAGIRKQVQLLTGENVLHDGIYKKVEKIMARVHKANAANPDPLVKEDFAALMRAVRTLTGNSSYHADRYFTGDQETTIANLQTFHLKPEHIKTLNQAVADTYGLAMSNAIQTVYGTLIEARKPLTAAVQLAVTTYNTILKKKVDLLVEAHKADATFKGDPEVITKEELDKILASIEHLIPKIKTPLYTKDSPSYLPMAEVGNNRSYTKQARVVQQYLQKGLVQHQGYAEGIPYLEDPGMSPVVKGIQMLDSMIANGLMGLDTHMLNNHDGFSHGIGDSEVIAQEANKIFAGAMTDYSLAQAFEEMHLELAEKGKAMLDALGVQPKDYLWGTSRNTDKPSAFTGGLVGDQVVSFDLLVSMGLASKEDRAAYVKDAQERGVPYRTAAQEYVNDVIARQGMPDANFTEKVLAQLTKNLAEIAEQTTRNKKEVMDSVRQWHQYPHHGTGYFVDNPVNTGDKIFGDIDTNTVLSHDAKARDKDIALIQGFQAEGYHSSPTGNVSTTEADYTQPSQVIDSQNVVESFDALISMDSKLAYASVQNSPSHVDYLRGVLNSIVSRVMGPVEMFMDQHKINNETQGMYTIGANGTQRIWIQTQQKSDHPLAGMLGQSIRMSPAEVYVHELVHHITHTGLKNFPHLQRQASALRELSFQEFSKAYGEHAYRVFLNDPTIDVADPANAYEVAAAKARWEYVFNTKRKADGSNAGLDEFISFGMTNENFKRELGKLQVSQEILSARKSLNTIFEKNIQQTLVNLFTAVLEFIYQRFNQQRHSTRVDQELENLVRAISYVDSKNKSVLWKFTADMEEAITAVSLQIDEKIVGMVKAAVDKTKVGSAINQLKQFPQLNNMLSHQMRIVLHWYTSQQQGLIPSIVTEMQGTTDRMRPFHDQLRMRNHVLDAAKNEATLVVRDKVNSWFKQALTPAQKTVITKALLKTDVGSLLDKGLSSQAITGYLAEDTRREARITEILNQLRNDSVLKDYAVYFENAADDLGYFMVHSARKTKDSMPLMNAHNIVSMRQSKHAGKLAGENYGRALDLVDQLATLSSLRYVPKAQRLAAAALMTSEWPAIENVLNQHNKLKDDAFRDLFHGNPVKMTKGYVEQILNSRVKFEQAHVANPDDPNDPTRKRFEDAGYYMQATPIPRDPADPVQDDIYMFRNMLGAVNDLQPGIASYSQNIGRGATGYDIQQQLGNTYDPAQEAERNNQIVLADTLNTIDNLFKVRPPAKQALGSGKNYMIPKFNDKGNIAEMRYMMSEATKDIVFEQFSEFDAVLGRMAATIIDKTVTPEINANVIEALKDVADHKDYGRKALPEVFVEISPWSPEKRYRDIYHQLPPNARTKILSIWGENRMWVAQDMVDLAFGQRKYSVSETFSKNKKESNLFEKMFVEVLKLALGDHNPLSEPPPGAKANDSVQGRAVRRTTAVYNTLAQVTKLGKANIVVRNLGVVFGNHNSNMMLLKSMGIPLEKIVLYNKEAMTGILQYQKDKHELESWRLELENTQRRRSITPAEKDIQTRNISRRIAVLENQLALNKATPLVKEGAMPSIVDDFDTDYVPPPFTYGVDALLDKSLDLLPKGLQRAGRTLFMTTDTEGFRMMNNAVKLTDFTGRYILYKHLTAKGMDHNLAVSTVMDKFINFDLPTHRMISMVNDIGLVMFSKYQLRVLKHIKDVLKEHPFTALATFLIGSHIGDNNIINSIPFVTKDVMQNVGNAASLTGTVWDTAVIDGVQYVGGLAADVVTPGT